MICFWLACHDPPTPAPTPPPSDLPRYSTAPHVHWAGLRTNLTASDRFLAVFVDTPGGALDVLAHDPDVATFLNDRFTPIFLTPQVAPDLPEAILFVDARGCLLLDPIRPSSPSAFIEAANQVMLGSPPRPWTPAPVRWELEIEGSHPLWLRCQNP